MAAGVPPPQKQQIGWSAKKRCLRILLAPIWADRSGGVGRGKWYQLGQEYEGESVENRLANRVAASRSKRHIGGMSIPAKIAPYFVTIGLPIALVLLGIILPIQFNQAGTLGELKAQLQGLDRKMDQVVTRSDSIDKSMASIDARLSAADSDPSRYIAALGISSQTMFSLIRVGAEGKLYMFPKTEAAKALLEQSGMKVAPVAPGIFGYPAPAEIVNMGWGKAASDVMQAIEKK